MAAGLRGEGQELGPSNQDKVPGSRGPTQGEAAGLAEHAAGAVAGDRVGEAATRDDGKAGEGRERLSGLAPARVEDDRRGVVPPAFMETSLNVVLQPEAQHTGRPYLEGPTVSRTRPFARRRRRMFRPDAVCMRRRKP